MAIKESLKVLYYSAVNPSEPGDLLGFSLDIAYCSSPIVTLASKALFRSSVIVGRLSDASRDSGELSPLLAI